METDRGDLLRFIPRGSALVISKLREAHEEGGDGQLIKAPQRTVEAPECREGTQVKARTSGEHATQRDQH